MTEVTDGTGCFIFLELLSLAAHDALAERTYRAIELRFGTDGDQSRTLEEVGNHFGFTRERARQVIKEGIDRIYCRGKKEIKRGEFAKPCAVLLSQVASAIRPEEDGHLERVYEFAENVLPNLRQYDQAIPLLSLLVYGKKNKELMALANIRALELRLTCQKNKRAARFRGLLDRVIKIQNVPVQSMEYSMCTRVRSTLEHESGHVGIFLSSKMGRDVQYESKSELGFFMDLEAADEVLWYQEQPFTVPYELSGKDHLYCPDVLISLENGNFIVAEIKPCFEMALKKNLSKWTALRKYCEARGWGILVTDGRIAIQDVVRLQVNPEYATEVISHLKYSKLSWTEYKSISDKYDVHGFEFQALVLKARLDWRLNPFNLSLSPDSHVNAIR